MPGSEKGQLGGCRCFGEPKQRCDRLNEDQSRSDKMQNGMGHTAGIAHMLGDPNSIQLDYICHSIALIIPYATGCNSSNDVNLRKRSGDDRRKLRELCKVLEQSNDTMLQLYVR